MKKLESSLKNMLLVLTGVTAISVALLAYVNELTKFVSSFTRRTALAARRGPLLP